VRIAGNGEGRLSGDIGSGRLLRVPFGAALFADFIRGDEKERDKSDREEQDGREAAELLHFAVEQGESSEDEEQMRAENLERGFAQSEERLAGDGDLDIFAEPVKDDQERRDVEDAERATCRA